MYIPHPLENCHAFCNFTACVVSERVTQPMSGNTRVGIDIGSSSLRLGKIEIMFHFNLEQE